MVRRFRRALRQLERVASDHSHTCCVQVTMAQCHVLLEIAEAGPLGCSELARRLRLDTSTISRTVDGLVGAGLVQRVENPDDRRSVILTCTREGNKLCREINRDADGFYERKLTRIPAAQQAQVLAGFESLVEALSEEGSDEKSAEPCCGCDGN
jgi:DNA-binding MarR family transcriptional regulator